MCTRGNVLTLTITAACAKMQPDLAHECWEYMLEASIPGADTGRGVLHGVHPPPPSSRSNPSISMSHEITVNVGHWTDSALYVRVGRLQSSDGVCM